MQLINEIVAYAETSMSRRKFILHYFGEDFDEVNGPGADMDDNSRFPRERYEGSKYIQVLLKTVLDGGEVHKSAYIVNVLTGKMTSEVQTYRGNESAYWEAGSAKEDKFWHAVTSQSVVNGYLRKEIESYGTLRVTEKGHAFLKSPHEIMLIQ